MLLFNNTKPNTQAKSATKDRFIPGWRPTAAALLLLLGSNTALAAPPVFTSPSIATVSGGQTRALDVDAIDDNSSDLNGLSYAISGGVDQSEFVIDAMTGVLSFRQSPGAANPRDIDTDNIYNLDVMVTDADGEFTTQAIEISVQLLPGPARVWHLDNVTFDTGAVAFGSFRFDPSVGQFGQMTDINVNVTKNGQTTSYVAVPIASRGNAGYVSLVTQTDGDLTGTPYLALSLFGSMTADDGELDILPGPVNLSYQGFCTDPTCIGVFGPFDEANAGGRLVAGDRNWVIENLTLASGGTVNGTFNFDPDAEGISRVSNLNVQATRNGNIDHFNTIHSVFIGSFNYLILVTQAEGDLSGTPMLGLALADEMTAAGGIIPVTSGTDGQLTIVGTCVTPTCDALDPNLDLALPGGQVRAYPKTQTWFFEGLRFDTGETLTGSFKYDPGPNNHLALGHRRGRFSDINVMATQDGNIAQYTAVNPISGGNREYLNFVTLDGVDLSNTPVLIISLESPMTTNGPHAILAGQSSESYQGFCAGDTCSGPHGPFDTALSGGRIVREIVRPTILTAPNVIVVENQSTVIDVDASDNLDTEGDGLVYSLSGGTDQNLFALNSANGVITFVVAPDFENPADADANNEYHVQITVTDLGGLTATQDILVIVADELTDNDTDGDSVPDVDDNCTLVANTNQRDTDGDGFGNFCDADLNNDGVVNFLDLGPFRDVFLSTDVHADFNGDGAVNFLDLSILRDGFLMPPGPSGLGF